VVGADTGFGERGLRAADVDRDEGVDGGEVGGAGGEGGGDL
jgi:hypothetical protein